MRPVVFFKDSVRLASAQDKGVLVSVCGYKCVCTASVCNIHVLLLSVVLYSRIIRCISLISAYSLISAGDLVA